MANVLYDLDKLRKVVTYVGQTQPLLDKAAAQDAALKARIPEVVDTLVRQGLLSEHLKSAKAKALESNPVEILDLLEKTAALVTPKSIGGGTGLAADKAPSADQVFEDRLMGKR